MRKATWMGVALVAAAGVAVAWASDAAASWADRHLGSTSR